MIRKKTISLIIPCRNEEKALRAMFRKMPSYIDEVVVVDNNSTDRTAEVAKANGARVFKETRQINGIGYGFAHQTGMKKASGDFVVTLDGDDTYPLRKIKGIINFMEKDDLDFVSCNRLPLDENQAINPIRQLGIYILDLWIALLYGYYFKDILTGMWAMRREVIDKLRVGSGDWNFSPEIKLAALVNKEIKFGEYHIPYKLRLGESKLKIWRTGINHFFFILNRRFTVDNPLSKFSLRPASYRMAKSVKSFLALFF